MKYRKKPVIIDAEQWYPGIPIEGVEWNPSLKDKALINTLEGQHVVSIGDWIITGVKGEKYPCKPDIFEMTYESVYEEKEI